ncbi:hypothetical protein [Streptomyces sp. BPSDS2]|uniref:hypothetical protein n=1 Tax=Streptomyces sp. BPSDS2 TaxID=2571021 RepID=UPI0010C177B0|nr:hypothetical protein [Streptomyces sp. BPSDS2]
MAAAVATVAGVLGSVWRKEWGPAFGRLAAGMLLLFVFANYETLLGWFEDVLAGGGGAPEPVESQPDSDGPSLWLPLALVAGGLAASLGLYGLGTIVQRRRARTAARRRTAAAAQTRRHAIEAEHDEVRDAYAAYICDVLAVLDRPALDDVTVPQTAALLHAMDAAADARRGSDLDTYREAVSTLKTAWRAADAHARKTGVRSLPASERSAIAKARRLFEKALDERGSQHERQALYAKARALLDGILVIPREAAAELETRHRLTLTKTGGV